MQPLYIYHLGQIIAPDYFLQFLQFKVSAFGTNTYCQPNSPLINRFMDDRLLDAWPTVNQKLPQLIVNSLRLSIDLIL